MYVALVSARKEGCPEKEWKKRAPEALSLSPSSILYHSFSNISPSLSHIHSLIGSHFFQSLPLCISSHISNISDSLCSIKFAHYFSISIQKEKPPRIDSQRKRGRKNTNQEANQPFYRPLCIAAYLSDLEESCHTLSHRKF